MNNWLTQDHGKTHIIIILYHKSNNAQLIHSMRAPRNDASWIMLAKGTKRSVIRSGATRRVQNPGTYFSQQPHWEDWCCIKLADLSPWGPHKEYKKIKARVNRSEECGLESHETGMILNQCYFLRQAYRIALNSMPDKTFFIGIQNYNTYNIPDTLVETYYVLRVFPT